ncbi:MAG: hypothetical protein R3A51_08725 [Nannocystaceae bacterium]
MGAVLTTLAAIAALASGMALFALARARGRARRIRHLSGGRDAALALPPARLPDGLSELLERSRRVRIELEAITLHAAQVSRLEEAIDPASRRPLWRRIEGASFDYAAARAAEGLRAWLELRDHLPAESREHLRQLALEDAPIRELLASDLDRGDLDPRGLAGALTRARAALQRHEQALTRERPLVYR